MRNETKDVLENYKSYTPESLFAYLMSYDCQYIFNNLPRDLQNEIDALAGEQRKEVQKQRVEVQKQIAERDKQIAEVQQLLNEIYQQECQIELNKIFLNDLNQ
jgi:RNase adaptor protein for sRNA GlmZ degradation